MLFLLGESAPWLSMGQLLQYFPTLYQGIGSQNIDVLHCATYWDFDGVPDFYVFHGIIMGGKLSIAKLHRRFMTTTTFPAFFGLQGPLTDILWGVD